MARRDVVARPDGQVADEVHCLARCLGQRHGVLELTRSLRVALDDGEGFDLVLGPGGFLELLVAIQRQDGRLDRGPRRVIGVEAAATSAMDDRGEAVYLQVAGLAGGDGGGDTDV